MLGIAIHCIQHSQAILERGVCELAHSFFHFFCLQHFSVNHDSVASVIKHLALVYRKQVGIGCQLSNDMYMKDVILTVCIGIVSKLKKGEGRNHQKSFYVQIVSAYIMSIFLPR